MFSAVSAHSSCCWWAGYFIEDNARGHRRLFFFCCTLSRTTTQDVGGFWQRRHNIFGDTNNSKGFSQCGDNEARVVFFCTRFILKSLFGSYINIVLAVMKRYAIETKHRMESRLILSVDRSGSLYFSPLWRRFHYTFQWRSCGYNSLGERIENERTTHCWNRYGREPNSENFTL